MRGTFQSFLLVSLTFLGLGSVNAAGNDGQIKLECPDIFQSKGGPIRYTWEVVVDRNKRTLVLTATPEFFDYLYEGPTSFDPNRGEYFTTGSHCIDTVEISKTTVVGASYCMFGGGSPTKTPADLAQKITINLKTGEWFVEDPPDPQVRKPMDCKLVH